MMGDRSNGSHSLSSVKAAGKQSTWYLGLPRYGIGLLKKIPTDSADNHAMLVLP